MSGSCLDAIVFKPRSALWSVKAHGEDYRIHGLLESFATERQPFTMMRLALWDVAADGWPKWQPTSLLHPVPILPALEHWYY